jgi:hypothetical protein
LASISLLGGYCGKLDGSHAYGVVLKYWKKGRNLRGEKVNGSNFSKKKL